MYCENCGKQLIRGYSFCIECGSPVPPEGLEEGGLPGRSGEAADNANKAGENTVKAAEENAGDVQASMPGIEPIGSNKDEGTLVFCPNCGMRMQHNLDFCEKCGMKISDKPSGSVPLINNTPMGLDGSFDAFGGGGGIGDIFSNGGNQFDNFIGGGGMPSAFDNAEETENLFGTSSYSANDMAILNQQISNFGSTASEMPEISKSAGTVRQQEPKDGETRKVENFSMSDVSDEGIPISDGAVPVIEGGSMDEDPSADVSLDPYTFLGNSMEEPGTSSIESVNVEAPEVEPAAVAVEEIEPVEDIADEPVAVEEVQPVEEIAEDPVAVEEIQPVQEIAEEPVAVEEIQPVEEVAEEPVAVEEVEPVEEIADEPVAVEEVEPVEEIAEEAVAVEEVEPVEEIADEPVAVEEVEPVEDIAEEPVAVEEAEPVEEIADIPVTEEPDFGSENFDFIPEEMGFIAETSSVPEETQPEAAPTAVAAATRQPVEDFDFRRPSAPQNNAPEQNPADEPHKGNLVYCRTCGQDMYDTEKFCKNCGATYKGAYVPPKTAPSKSDNKKPQGMVFGKIPLTKFVGAVAGVVGAAALILFLIQPWQQKPQPGPDPKPDTSSQSISSSVDSTSESTSSTSSDNSGVVSSSSSTESSASSSSTDTSSESTSSESTSSSSSSSSSTKTSSSSSTNPVITADTKLKSLEQDREKIMFAAELIAGEVGKMEALSQHVIFAMNESTESNEEAIKTFYNTKFAVSMVSNLKSGKTTVERAISSASPKNSEFSSLYTALKTLKTRYDTYYNFITSPNGGYSSFTKNCQSYYTMVTSALSNLNLSKFTTSYTAAYKNIAYKSMVSDAVSAVKNCATQLSALQSQLSGLDPFERKAFSTLSSDVSAYASAVSYSMRAKAYSIMLKGVTSNYSSALTYIDNAYNSTSSFLKTCTSLSKTNASTFNNNVNATIITAKNNANSAAKVIS